MPSTRVKGGKSSSIISRPNLLTPQQVEVTQENDLVCIRVGNSTMKLHYEAALQISQWIRFRAKQAKESVGDKSRHWSVIGELHDASKG